MVYKWKVKGMVEKMTELEINRTIHEEIRGLCWHEWVLSVCQKCHAHQRSYKQSPTRPSYTTKWADYGPMIEWAMKEPWWDEFKIWHATQAFCSYRDKEFIHQSILNPFTGSTMIAKFWEERK